MIKFVRVQPCPEECKSRTHPKYVEGAFEKWVKEQKATIPYDGEDYIFTGSNGPWDFAWIKGGFHKRDVGYSQIFFYFYHEGIKEESCPHVVCECGEDKFTLHYGSYELRARCSSCGKEEAVYSG